MCVLLLTNSEDATIDYLESHLPDSGFSVARYNTDIDLPYTDFNYSQCVPSVSWRDHHIKPKDISAVVLRRPKPFKPVNAGDQFQAQHLADEWGEAWEGFLAHIPVDKWINHPSYNFAASHKIEQLTRANKFRLHVPQSFVTNDPYEALSFREKQINGVIVKPLSSGYIEREKPEKDTLIYTREFSDSNLECLESLKYCPVLFQEKIDKDLDVRLTVLDEKMVAVGMKSPDSSSGQELDIRRNNMKDLEYELIDVPQIIHQHVTSLLRSYYLRFAALDFAINKNGEWVFFEINPNGQWAWLDLDAGANIKDLFISALS